MNVARISVRSFKRLAKEKGVFRHSITKAALGYSHSRVLQRGIQPLAVFDRAKNFDIHHSNYTDKVAEIWKSEDTETF